MFTLGGRSALFVGVAGGAFLWACTASAANVAPASSEASASALEEVVVTARRREENLQTVPVSITAISSETLQARNVFTLAKVARIAPNVTMYETTGTVGVAGAFIRGIGYSENQIGQDSPIGFYIDGVAAGRVSVAAMDLVEPERVEVLRGPQGTLFGRNTTGGAFLVTTHQPRDEFGGMVKASYGTFHAQRFQARIDTGLLGDSGVKMTFAYAHRQNDGTRDAGLKPSSLDPGAKTDDAYFIKAMGDWDQFTATLTADYSRMTGVPARTQVVDAPANERTYLALSPTYGGNTYPLTTSALGYNKYDAYGGEQWVWNEGLGLTLAYKVNDALTFKSISGLRAYKRNDPTAYGPTDLRGNFGTVAAPRIQSSEGVYSLAARGQGQRQTSEELQALGNVSDFDYVAGFYYFKENAWDYGVTRIPFVAASGLTATDSITNRLYTATSKSVAAFSQVDYRPAFLDRKLELSGGVRWTKDTRHFRQTQAFVRNVDLSGKNTSFLASANYQWTSGLMTYARYTTGYRSGGFNARSPNGTNPLFTPEHIKSLELGFKWSGIDNRVRLNGSVFRNKYRDLQVSQYTPPTINTSGGGGSINANANYKGFELELLVAPVERLTINAAVGYLDPDYKSYPTGLIAGAVSPGCTALRDSTGAINGQDCAATAKFTTIAKKTGNIGASYALPDTGYGELSFRADYSYKGHTDFGTFNTVSTPFQNVIQGKAYGLLSARIALSDIPLAGGRVHGQISIYGDNLTNKDYVVQGVDIGFAALQVFGEPRTIGIEGKVEF
jgi:iron complex outermembrane receptor protein